jgi:hypothetical protein
MNVRKMEGFLCKIILLTNFPSLKKSSYTSSSTTFFIFFYVKKCYTRHNS